MRALVHFAVALVVISSLACSGGASIPSAPSPAPPAPASPPAPSPAPPPLSPPPVVQAKDISIGETVQSQVTVYDPICDPTGWDANAQCRQFRVVPPQDGTLHVVLKPAIPAEKSELLDLLVWCPGAPAAYSGGGLEQRLSVAARVGTACFITIHYYAYLWGTLSADFELRTDM